ncbi:hypothetical protein ANO11243_063160 [Dothideomycetidae sp. 11243]|nr:hypothetical protein ANO11243_063160 [fungal sp. No.11243]
MPSKKDPPEVKFARQKIIYVLGAFILGLLCSTHPKRYLQDPAYGHKRKEEAQDRSKGKNKQTQDRGRKKRRSREDEDKWQTRRRVTYVEEDHPLSARAPLNGRINDEHLRHPPTHRHHHPSTRGQSSERKSIQDGSINTEYSASIKSVSTALSWGSKGSSFARLLGRRHRDDERFFKRARKAAEPLGKAKGHINTEAPFAKSTSPVIVAISGPSSSGGLQRTPTMALKQLPIGADFLGAIIPSPEISTPKEDTKSIQIGKPANHGPETPKRPVFRKGRSARSSAHSLMESASLSPTGMKTPTLQSPLSTPLAFVNDDAGRSSKSNEEYAYLAPQSRPESPSYMDGVYVRGSPRSDSFSSVSNRKSFFSSLWSRRVGTRSEDSPRLSTPLLGHRADNPMTGSPDLPLPPSRPNYFSRHRHQSDDTIVTLSPRTSAKASDSSSPGVSTSTRLNSPRIQVGIQSKPGGTATDYTDPGRKEFVGWNREGTEQPDFVAPGLTRIDTPPLLSATASRIHRGGLRNLWPDTRRT